MYDVAKFVKKDERYLRYGFFYLALKYASIMEPHQSADKRTLNCAVFFMSMEL